VFCGIAQGAVLSSVVYEDDVALVFLDIRPINPGHLLVIPREHYPSLSVLPRATGAHLFTLAQRAAEGLRRTALHCEGINVFLSDGEVAGQEVPHCHLHVLPRFKGDGVGLEAASAREPTRRELDDLAGRIRSAWRADPGQS
jgi:diadenosine tetraphosphate (Ap4A) HIT family hydrolase